MQLTNMATLSKLHTFPEWQLEASWDTLTHVKCCQMASFKPLGPPSGVYSVGVVPAPDSNTCVQMSTCSCVQACQQLTLVAVSTTSVAVLTGLAGAAVPAARTILLFVLKHWFSYQKTYLGLQFRDDQEYTYFASDQWGKLHFVIVAGSLTIFRTFLIQ